MKRFPSRTSSRKISRGDSRPQCQMCKAKISGTQYAWGSVRKLCLSCYRTHCKSYITRANLEKKIRTQMGAAQRVAAGPKRGFWRNLFG